MRKYSRSIAIAFLMLCFGFPARAENVTVPAGRSSPIGHLMIYNKFDCGYGAKPKVTISRQARHGIVRVEWRLGVMGSKRAGRCRGKKAYGMVAWYTPKAGYHGPDHVTIGLRSVYHGTSSYYHAFKIDITVK